MKDTIQREYSKGMKASFNIDSVIANFTLTNRQRQDVEILFGIELENPLKTFASFFKAISIERNCRSDRTRGVSNRQLKRNYREGSLYDVKGFLGAIALFLFAYGEQAWKEKILSRELEIPDIIKYAQIAPHDVLK